MGPFVVFRFAMANLGGRTRIPEFRKDGRILEEVVLYHYSIRCKEHGDLLPAINSRIVAAFLRFAHLHRACEGCACGSTNLNPRATWPAAGFDCDNRTMGALHRCPLRTHQVSWFAAFLRCF